MKLTSNKPQKKHSITIIIFLCCISLFIVGFITPVYFVNAEWRFRYYLGLIALMAITGSLTVFRLMYDPNKDGELWPALAFFIAFISSVPLGGFLLLLALTTSWSQAGTEYYRKDNPSVKIISRYTESRLLDWGTSGEKFHTALQRPFWGVFKIEIAVDKDFADSSKWVKVND
jgi:hypothetical protein